MAGLYRYTIDYMKQLQMAMVSIVLLWLVGLAGCITTSPGRTPTAKPTMSVKIAPVATTPARPTSVATVARTPTPGPSPTPTEILATPATKLNIVVDSPKEGQRVSSPVRVAGMARVFEASVAIRIRDVLGREIGRGHVVASEGAPGWGKFAADIPFLGPDKEQVGSIEVFSLSPRDGSEENKIIIRIILVPK